MDFTFTEEQDAVSELAAQIFAGHASVEQVKKVEASDDRFDEDLWIELAKSNLLGIALPEDVGGSGLGLIELCLLLEQQGRFVAPVPLWPTMVAALAVAEFGSPTQRTEALPTIIGGGLVMTVALEQFGEPIYATPTADGWKLNGFAPSVPAAPIAAGLLVPAVTPNGDTIVATVDATAEGVMVERLITTNRQLHGHVTLVDASVDAGDLLAGARVEWIRQRAMVALCALQVGIAEAAVQQAAQYSSGRVQFGKPLSTFQGAALKAADAYIDTEAMRVTLWQAAWKLSEGLEAAADVAIAKWWAAEGGHRVVHVAQHLHGGIGSDIDYPIHRYFLWGKQIEDTMGGAGQQQARLGRMIAEGAR